MIALLLIMLSCIVSVKVLILGGYHWRLLIQRTSSVAKFCLLFKQSHDYWRSLGCKESKYVDVKCNSTVNSQLNLVCQMHTLDSGGTHIPRIDRTVCVFSSRGHVHAPTCIPLHVQHELHFWDNSRVWCMVYSTRITQVIAQEREYGAAIDVDAHAEWKQESNRSRLMTVIYSRELYSE